MPKLDAAQQAAVDSGPTDAFISAGAGAGKTRVLVTRFVHAVLGIPPYEPCDPGQLLTVTYTEKAAAELAERIRRELGGANRHDAARRIGEAWISTIHGMCARILRQYAFDAGLDPRFGVLDAAEASALETAAFEEAIREWLTAARPALDLIDEFSIDTVSAAVRELRASTRALGLGIDAIATISPAEALDRLSAIGPALREAAAEIDALGQTATVCGNAAVARAAAETLELAEAAASPAETAALLENLSAQGMRAVSSVEGLVDRVAETRELIDDARCCAAQLHAGPREAVLLDLVARFDRMYAEMKHVRGVVDFEDLQLATARLLDERPDLAAELRARFAMVMVDEFQDANALQLRIVERLSDNNLCTVGDENQSIYAFRHADVEVFRSRARTIPRHDRLETNYRSDPGLVAAVAGLFTSSALLGPGLTASPPGGSPISTSDTPAELRFLDLGAFTGDAHKDAEARYIADRVVELMAQGFEPGDIAVLLQRCASGRALAVGRALEARGIPAVLASGGGFFECAEVRETRMLLQVIDNVYDDAALVSLLAGRLGGLSADALFTIREHANLRAESLGVRTHEVHLWDVLREAGDGLAPVDALSLERVRTVVEAVRRRRGARALETTIIDALEGLDADLVYASAGPAGAKAWLNVLKLARMSREYEDSVGGGVTGFLGHLRMLELHAAGEAEVTLDEEAHAVRVMSIHASKGLEFPAVIVGGLCSRQSPGRIELARVGGVPLLGIKPTWGGKNAETLGWRRVAEAQAASDAGEIARVLYVACTRARDDLTVFAAIDPAKDADNTPAGLFRHAAGVSAAGTVREGVRTVGHGRVRITLLEPDADLPDTPRSERTAVALASPDGDPSAAGAAPPAVAVAPCSGAHDLGVAHPPGRVSYSSLSVYASCPYRYYLTTVARVGQVPDGRKRDPRAFGNAVHAVLEVCDGTGADVSERVRDAATAAGLEAADRARVEVAVRAFLSSDVAAKAFAAHQVVREAPFALPVAGTTLVGSIDLLSLNGEDALVVDYKTGGADLDPEAARDRFRLQGRCYALAAFAAGALTARVVFAELERDRQVVFEYSLDDRRGIEAEITRIVDGISAHRYPPRPAYEAGLCESCPGFGGMCPVTRPADVAG